MKIKNTGEFIANYNLLLCILMNCYLLGISVIFNSKRIYINIGNKCRNKMQYFIIIVYGN